ncbi:amidohydrolase 3 [Russula earlei]|uniref:Amidohydrolase 3 n=1 Tax=Russula earlei TaxID=71964 RepID=A0ACC0TSG2_9AGAM|nr:amidohydrolase 3 [Russula earlei]
MVLIAACSSPQQADLVVHHAKIYTVDSGFTIAEALAVRDGKIIAVGSNEAIMKQYHSKDTIDAQGKTLYPGFIDAHAHFVGYGRSLFEINLVGTESWEDIIHHVCDFAKGLDTGAWILGRGWDQNDWPIKSFPTNERFNKIFPDRPLLLTRIDGHAAIANAKALAMAGIQPGQKIEGGEIETKNGKLTGMLIDNAVGLVKRIISNPSKATYEQWLLAAQQNCFAVGLTTVTDCGLGYKDVEAIDTLQKQGKLLMRMYVMLSDNKENFDRYLPRGPYKTDRLFVKGFKFYADGALGSRGACLLYPYNDKPGWEGFLLSSRSHYDSMAAILVHTDFQMCTHAIGDSGNRVILTVYNHVLQGKNDKRWRIEHAQVVNEQDFVLFAQSSVIPSVQPTHATSDMYWAGERLGAERLRGAYAYQRLLQQNGWLPLGTDFPVEDISPFKTFYAAVVRKDAKGFPPQGFQMENALTREEALRGMTIWAAKADFLEKETGSIEKDKKADFIILDNDIMTAPATELLNTKVLATYCGGRKVY